MQKQIGSILIVAGTCIGAGTLALPLVIAPLGLIPGILTMIGTWALAYYTSLIHLELNLQAGTGLDLGQLANRFSGKTAQLFSTVILTLLMYALMTAYLYGGSTVIQKLISNFCTVDLSQTAVASGYALGIMLILLLPLKLIDYANRCLLISLFGVAAFLIGGLASITSWSALPLWSPWCTANTWAHALPVIFTSFGFQVIFHTLVNYCNKDTKMLKHAFFWGSLIPTVLYIVWSTTVITSIYSNNQLAFGMLEQGSLSIAELIAQLSLIAQWPTLQLLTWIITLLAITTSALGVGAGLVDSVKSRVSPENSYRAVLAALAATFPAYVLALAVPNAFITVLGFAGMLLAFIAIIIPAHLLFKARVQRWHYPELNHSLAIFLCVFFACTIIAAELYSIYG